MTLEEAIRRRRSVRRFAPDPVPEADLERLVALAQLAPSASNQQMWRFLAITNREVLERMRGAVLDRYDELAGRLTDDAAQVAARGAKGYSSFFADAPVTIAVLAQPYQSPMRQALLSLEGSPERLGGTTGYPDVQSIGAAIAHLLLAATELGYGTCWMTGPLAAREQLEAILGVQPPWRLLALVPVGKPADAPGPHGPRREGSGLSWVR
jgi:nitroreductase